MYFVFAVSSPYGIAKKRVNGKEREKERDVHIS
jgi:hypothetical protein